MSTTRPLFPMSEAQAVTALNSADNLSPRQRDLALQQWRRGDNRTRAYVYWLSQQQARD